jgi:hypothetical protein
MTVDLPKQGTLQPGVERCCEEPSLLAIHHLHRKSFVIRCRDTAKRFFLLTDYSEFTILAEDDR